MFCGDKKDTEVAIVIRADLFCLCIGKLLQLKEMSVIDVSQVRDNQNVLMELNRKQVCLLSDPKENSLLRNKLVVE